MSLWSRWSGWPLTRKSVVVVTGPLLLLLVSVLAIYRLERQTAQAEEDVRLTLAIISDLHEVHSLLAETAAGVRGYVLVRRDNFLDPYRDAEPRLLQVVRQLAERGASGPRADRFQGLIPLFEAKLRGWRTLLEGHARASPAWIEARLVEGKDTLDVLRTELRVLGVEERNELAARTLKAAHVRQRNLAVTLAFALAGGLGAVAAVATFAGSLVRRLRGVAAEADRLGSAQPGVRPDPPPAAERDELGQLRMRLHEAGTLLHARATQIEDARRDAEAANQAKTVFLSRMSHELRTPLNAILGYAQVLVDEAGDPRASRFAGHIEVAGRHLLGLITEMLDVSGIEAGTVPIETRDLRLAAALAEALDLVRPQAEAAAIRLAPLPPTPVWVRADAQRLRQVLLNLLGNAIKFNRVHGTVSIEVGSALHGAVDIAVLDEGRGVDAADRPRLFKPFERIEATARGIDGTGLGLAVSRRLVEAMGGEIGMAPRPMGGSRFWLRLPVGQDHSATPGAEPPVAVAEVQPRRLLLVEDHASNRALLLTLLERRPQWQVQCVSRLAEARTALQAESWDAVLLDLRLPDGDGSELLDAPTAGTTLPPVVVLSADAGSATRQRLLALGAVGFITKPIDVQAFFRVLDEVLA